MTEISLDSKLSFKQTNEFVYSINELVEKGEKSIVIDMNNCKYLNSLMLSGLIRAQKICKKENCDMVLDKVNASAMTLFETTNVLSLFTINSSETPTQNSELELSYQEFKGKVGLFIIQGSLSNLEHSSKFRSFYEKYSPAVTHGILDCLNLQHLGSSGVTELFRLRGILQEKSGRLIIVSQMDSVESVWRMMHLESLIPKVGTVQEALKLTEASSD